MITSVAIISFTPDSGTLPIDGTRGPGKYRVNIPIEQEGTIWYACGGPAPTLAAAIIDALDTLQAGGEDAATRAAGLAVVLAAWEQNSIQVPSELAQRVTRSFEDALSDLVENQHKRKGNK